MPLVPPKVSHFEFSKELNVGDRTSVQCVAGTGDLPLLFTWLKDNVPIKQSVAGGANDNINADSRYNNDKNNNRLSNKDGVDDNNLIMIRQNDEFTSALSITSIKQSHAGEYTCRVQNDAATIQYSAMLKVNGSEETTIHHLKLFSCAHVFHQKTFPIKFAFPCSCRKHSYKTLFVVCAV